MISLSSADFFQNKLFQKIFRNKIKVVTVWFQFKDKILLVLIWHMLSDGKSCCWQDKRLSHPGLEVIKREFILRLKIKHNDWLLADTCPQSANQCALF